MKLNMGYKKMNKKGYVFSATLLVVLIVIGVIVILPLFISGGLTFSVLNKIPAPIWVILGIVLLFKLMRDKKK
jgi:hypothetical protein